MTWNNKKQQAVNGRVYVTKYWPNPLWQWEWTYGYIKDNPNDSNPFYLYPIPATDFEVLKGFYAGVMGGGNPFAYQPPDSARGGIFGVTQVTVNVNGYAICQISGAIYPMRLGDRFYFYNFSVATWLNGQLGTVVQFNQANSVVTLLLATGGTRTTVADSGLIAGGQPLSNPDALGNVELVNTIGSYPTNLSLNPTMALVTESVQLMDTSGLAIFNGVGASLTYTLNQPGTVAPYQGYVATISGSPTLPLTAQYDNYYYRCRFSEDSQEYENWLAMLQLCKSVKFEQWRV